MPRTPETSLRFRGTTQPRPQKERDPPLKKPPRKSLLQPHNPRSLARHREQNRPPRLFNSATRRGSPRKCPPSCKVIGPSKMALSRYIPTAHAAETPAPAATVC